ncbi:GerAB/ArcD/ProY family transporter [Alkalihalobacillus sp. 1P02AB]|uniref:GerAB/ArcD/ProY family transporter n=1 Tax=Alkalihalobacillus sp. 1P02AB TaxID=3132260 RepID=UPI0039A734F9
MDGAKISLHQLYFLIVQTQIGIGVLSLPFSVFNVSENDGWISVLVAGVIVQIILLLIWKIDCWMNGRDLFVQCREIFGKYFGNFLKIVFLVYFLAIGTTILILYSNIMKKWVFIFTPKIVIMGLLLLITIYLVDGGLTILARVYVLMTALIIFLIILVSIGLKNAHYVYLLPIGVNGMTTILKGSKECIIAMLGFELIFLFLGPTQSSNRNKLKVLSLANLTVTIIYSFIVFTATVFFSPDEIKLVPEPVLYMMKDFTFIVLERVDLLFLSIWIVVVATTFSSYLYAASQALKHLFLTSNHNSNKPYFVYIVGGIMLILALLPESHLQIDKISSYIGNMSLIFISFMTLLFFFSAMLVRKKLGGRDEKLS